MAPEPTKPPAQQARERGNESYMNGDLGNAIRFYRIATSLDPSDSVAAFNLAGAKLEQGLYAEALIHALDAVQRDRASGKSISASRCERILKTAILSKDTRHTIEIEQALSEFPEHHAEVEELKTILLGQRAAMFDGDLSRIRKHREHVVDHVPRLRPALFSPISRYFPLGSDTASSIITPAIRRATESKSTELAFMLGGYGDARHLYATLLAMEDWERTKKPCHQYHFTLVESLPHHAARLAVFCYLMMTPPDNTNVDVASMVVSMAFATSRIPQFIYDLLVNAMKAVKESLLLDGTVARCPFLWIPASSIPAIVNCLACWSIERTFQRNKLPFRSNEEDEQPHNADEIMWEAARVVRIFDHILVKYDPLLAKKIFDFEDKGYYGSKEDIQKFATFINTTWIVNPFLWDATVALDLNDLNSDNPPEIATHLIRNIDSFDYQEPDPQKPVLLTLCHFFYNVGLAFFALQDRITLEVFTGELDETCERMCIKHLPHRAGGTVAGRPDLNAMRFPWLYDHIHCSNVPEYIGGMLPMMRHCLPLLKHKRQSVVSASATRNIADFPTISSLVAEFTALKSPDLFYKMAGADVDPECEGMQLRVKKQAMVSFESLWYFSWWRTRDMSNYLPMSTPSSPEPVRTGNVKAPVLPRRAQFEHWAMTLFWRIAVPTLQKDSDELEREVKCMPENTSSFVRILDFAHRHGNFPGHWINSLLSAILSGRPSIPATIPLGKNMSPEEAIGAEARATSVGSAVSPTSTSSSSSNTTFWVAELATILAIWRPVLGWGLSLPLPPLSRIRRYSATLRIDPRECIAAPHHGLLLYDTRRLRKPLDLAVLIGRAHQMRHRSNRDGSSDYSKEKGTGKMKSTEQEDERKEGEKEGGRGNLREKLAEHAEKDQGVGKENEIKSAEIDEKEERVKAKGTHENSEDEEDKEKEKGKSESSDDESRSGSSSDSAVTLTEGVKKLDINDADGAFHVVSVFEWGWQDLEARTGVATWWLRADLMDAILAEGTEWELCLWRTNSWECVIHDPVRGQDIKRHGTWDSLLTDNGANAPLQPCHRNEYFSAPVAALPYDPATDTPTLGTFWLEGQSLDE